MVLDIQGPGYTLYNPEIASADLQSEDGGYQFCTGNLTGNAIDKNDETFESKFTRHVLVVQHPSSVESRINVKLHLNL